MTRGVIARALVWLPELNCCLRSADIWGRGIAHDARRDCASTCVASGSPYATGPFSTLDPRRGSEGSSQETVNRLVLGEI